MDNKEQLKHKLKLLKDRFKELNRVIIAFSGGVDSTFLLKVARDVLGAENVLAATANSSIRFNSARAQAGKLATEIGVKQLFFSTREIDDDRFTSNDKLRCYYCKLELYTRLQELAREENIKYIIDGSNYDDLTHDYRPGHRALRELQIISPLQEVEFSKDEIRFLSRELKLPTWNRPSDTCLATRFSYGINLNEARLKQLQTVEGNLRGYGFSQLRARIHDLHTVRIEVLPEEINKIIENRDEIVREIKNAGFNYITLDLEGFRSGSMNELLKGE